MADLERKIDVLHAQVLHDLDLVARDAVRVVELADQAAVFDVLLQLVQLLFVLLGRLCGDLRLFLSALQLHLERFELLHELGNLALLFQREAALLCELLAQLLVVLSVFFQELLPVLDDLLIGLKLSLEQSHLLFEVL